MAESRPNMNVSSLIFIQMDGEKTTRVEIALSKTTSDLRTMLLSQGIKLSSNIQFVDVNDYPVPIISEKSVVIRELVTSINDENIVRLKSKGRSTTAHQPRRMSIMAVIFLIFFLCFGYFMLMNNSSGEIITELCSSLNKSGFPQFYDMLNCPTYQKTSDYLEQKIIYAENGEEIFVTKGNHIEKLKVTDDNAQSMTMYMDWIQNEAQYKADYEWYTNMKSNSGHCAGYFNENIMHSSTLIKDTPESIRTFTATAFQDWPEKLRTSINIENALEDAKEGDGGPFSLATNGKMQSNMYLVAWKREEKGTIRIHTHVTVFERTAGENCVFNPAYWSGNMQKIKNAKNYFLLNKIRTNPVYKTFLLGIRRK